MAKSSTKKINGKGMVILTAIDFSPNSLRAADYAAALARQLKAKLVLLHVFLVPVPEEQTMLGAILYGSSDFRKAAEKKLFAIAKKYAGKVDVSYRLEEGIAPVTITDIAKKINAGMIVLGRTGKGMVQRVLVGTTTASVIAQAKCKVLVVAPGSKFRPYRKIVFATDLRHDNLRFAHEAAAFVKQFNAEMIFLYVDNRFMIHSDEEIAAMTNKMRSRTGYNKISGYVCSETNVREGINYFLKHRKADLLAMATHRHKYPEALWSKSVTQKISNNIKLPLLVFEEKK